MKTELYTKEGELIEIEKVSYLKYSRKDTMVDYDYWNDKKRVLFEGWLSLEQICEKLIEIIEEDEGKSE